MAPMPPTSHTGAELLKLEGNACYFKGRYAAAIESYTQAITLCPDIAVLWTNRALCHRKRNEWLKVENDCRKAIQLDHNSVKGHYMLGLALLQKENYADGVKELEKAIDLGRGADPKGYMVEEIWQSLAKAKYLAWDQESTLRTSKFQTIKEECEAALEQKHLDDFSAEIETEDSKLKEQLQLLSEVFRKATESDIPTEVPDYLCCKITLDILRDPVITPCGITYERAVLLDHLEMVGNFDPITRAPLKKNQLVSNLAMKEAVQAFLNDHSWAYQTT